jgi:hypothetical protein
MRDKFNLRNEKGAVMVLVALMSVVLLGFTALAVDLGTLAAEKQRLVTAADAGALAGARQLQVTEGEDISGAEDAARMYAIANGANADTLEVNPPSSLPHPGYTQKVEVIAHSNVDLMFARVLGFSNSDVRARAVATWGYRMQAESIIPLFYELDKFEEASGEALLHLWSDEYGANWGIFKLTPTSDIHRALMGERVTVDLEVGDEAESQTGAIQSIIKALNNDTEGQDKWGRLYRHYRTDVFPPGSVNLIGLIPIVTILSPPGTSGELDLRIEGFEYFEIQDVVVDNHGNGSLYSTNRADMSTRGITRNHYPNCGKGTVIGRFVPEHQGDPPAGDDIVQIGIGSKYVRLCE